MSLHPVGHFRKQSIGRRGESSLRQPDDPSGGDRVLNQKSYLGHLNKFFKWDGRRFAVADWQKTSKNSFAMLRSPFAR